jgi:pseudaminic acid cytidylyltransferase
VALKSGLFDEVMVSTDDEEIIGIARQYGARVPFVRTETTANDHATLADVIREVMERYEEEGKVFDNVCCILATAPLISPEDIRSSYDRLVSSDFVTVYPVVAFSYPILRALQMDAEGGMTMRWSEYAKTRSQDLETMYHDSGTFYWHKVAPWRAGIQRRGGIVVDESRVQDIDTETDWKLAEMKFRMLHG